MMMMVFWLVLFLVTGLLTDCYKKISVKGGFGTGIISVNNIGEEFTVSIQSLVFVIQYYNVILLYLLLYYLVYYLNGFHLEF